MSGRDLRNAHFFPGPGLPRASRSSAPLESLSRFALLPANQARTQRVLKHRLQGGTNPGDPRGGAFGEPATWSCGCTKSLGSRSDDTVYRAVRDVRNWRRPRAAGLQYKEAMQIHLDEIAKSVTPGARALLILDQAGSHGAKDLRLPSNLSILPLPPRAPELNQENVWQFMRQAASLSDWVAG
jgi:hypothetical protein